MNRTAFFLLLLTGVCGFSGVKLDAQDVDWVLFNGNVVTVDGKNPAASAIALSGERILAVGNDREVRALCSDSTRVIDLEGKTVVPGFIESHAHLTGIGRMLTQLDLTKATSWEEIVELVQAAVRKAKPGEWIVGRGWHQSLWKKKPVPSFDGYPIHEELSRVSPDNPVYLTHRSGHMCFANQRAMRLAGVSRGTVPPAGGEIPRDPKGDPIGVFRETAQGLISGALGRSRSDMTAAEIRREFENYIELAQRECLKRGVTTFCDAGMSINDVLGLKQLVDKDQLDLRVWIMLRTSNARLKRDLPKVQKIKNYGGGRIHVGGIKQMLDGALGAHGAWLLKPYSDLPESTGLVVTPVETIRETGEIAFRNNLQLCVHAIGDRANREMLDLFEGFYRRAGDRKLRWRVEHAQHLHPDDIARFGSLGVIASMQAIHCTSDGPFVPARLGKERSRSGAYAWRSLLDSGAVIANGSDAPVEPVDPLLGFHSTVTRTMKGGQVFFGEQKLTPGEALKSYTRDAAYAIFEEKNRGSISVGKQADLVVLSQDIMNIEPAEILKTRVLKTFVAGDLVFEAK
ncbi:MAG: amidohydrolase [Planctomycetota bacterium]|nr:amidohydrolase [Planctomycetota bacterium]